MQLDIHSLSAALLAAPCLMLPVAAQSWRDVSPPGGFFDRVEALTVDPADAEHLVARNYVGLFESTDGGQSWAQLDTSALPGPTAALTLTIDGDLFVGVTRALQAAPAVGRPVLYRRSATGWDPFGPDVNRSPALTAAQWRAAHFVVGRGEPDRMALLVHELGNFEYGAEGQYFLSDDGGMTWDGPTPAIGDPRSLQILERAQGPALLSVLASYPSTGTVSSLERSTSWGAPVEYLQYVEGYYAPTLSRTEPGRSYMATTSGYTLDPRPLERSDDVGTTWVPFGASDYFSSPRVGAVADELMLRSTTSAFLVTGRIELSWDRGATWQTLPDPPVAGVAAGGEWNLVLAHDDTRVYAWNRTSEVFAFDLVTSTGLPECSAQPNATGRPATIRTFGSPSIAMDDLRVHIDSVPVGTATLLIASKDPGFVISPGGSFGDLCLGGTIGRFDVTSALPTAEAFFDVPVAGLPSPTGSVMAQAGETWRFQAWFRDSQAGQTGSNFSDAVALTFLP